MRITTSERYPHCAARLRAASFRGFVLGFAAVVLLLSSPPAPAPADTYWNAASDDWLVPTDWSGGALPTSTTNADLYNGGTATVTTTGNACNALSLGSTAGSGTIEMTGGGLTVNNIAYVGYSGPGSFTQSGGTHSLAGNGDGSMILGYNSSGSGAYSLSGTGQLSGGWEWIGYSGTGTFTQSGGANTISNYLDLGYNAGGYGTYSLCDSGLLSAGAEQLGFYGTGTFSQSGGTNAVTGELRLGCGVGSGSYSLGGSGLLSAATEYVASASTGSFTHSGGTNAIANYLYLGFGSGSSGTYCLSDSALLSAPFECVGYSGTGTFTQSGGANAIASNLYLGYYSGSSGTYNLDGGTLITSSLSSGSGNAAFNFGGGTLQPGRSLSTTLPMTLTGSGGNATVDTAGFTVTLSGGLCGPGGLTKTDGGTLVLASANTYAGDTLIGGAPCN